MQKYQLSEKLPPSELITIHQMRPYLVDYPVEPFRPHLHGFNQILWFRSGSGRHLVDFVEREYEAGSLFYIPHGAVHAFRKDPNADGIIVHFDDVMAMGTSDGQPLPEILRAHTLDSGHCRTLPSPHAALIEGSLDTLSTELCSLDDFGKSTAIEAALRLLLVRAGRVFARSASEPSAKHKRFLQFSALVERDFAAGLSIEAYAATLGVSAKTLSRSVREATSTAPKDVISKRVTLEIKRLLVHTDLSVKEIAAQVGMNASYAVRFFRTQTGVTPTAFRSSWR